MQPRLIGAVAVAAVLASAFVTAQGPAPTAAGALRRTADGKPDLSGIWQVMATANWNVVGPQAQPGVPAGQGVVEGNEIPYQPWAVAKQKENFAKRMMFKVTNDPHRYDSGEPELQCYRPGIPRANYMPFPFQIFQAPDQILIV